MRAILWAWVVLPVFHFFAVALVLAGLEWLGKRIMAAVEELKRANSMAMALPVGARMAECKLQVTRANGTVEKPQVHRTYRNRLLRWGWAIKHAFTS